jgi:tetratricopeptide (TPR) repeat protein
MLAVLLGAPLAARADEITPKARVFADRGRELHAQGNYAAAIDAFKEAYVISPAPALLFNLAQSYRLEGACDDARIMYRRYLASDPPPEGREIAEQQLVNVDRCAREHVALQPPPPPPVSVVATTPQDVDTGADHARLEKDIGIGFAVAGGLALGGALYYELQAVQASNDVSDAYAKGGAGKDIAPIDARGRRDALDAKLLAGGGTLAVLGGVALYLVGYRAEGARPAVAVVPTSGGAHVSMSWVW